MEAFDGADLILIGITLALLALGGALHTRMLKCHDDQITALRTDVEFLKDHTVARETEARP